MTDEQLAAIRNRIEAATKGPWGIPPRRSNSTKFWLQPYKDRGDWQWTYRGFITCFFERDAEFIAHAREDIPALLGEIERLRKLAYPSESST